MSNVGVENLKITENSMTPVISERGEAVISRPNTTVRFDRLMASDSYDKQTNPNGFINMGTAENKLCADLIGEKMRELQTIDEEESERYYQALKGPLSFRKALIKFFERHFKPTVPLNVENIVISCGTSAVLETVSFALAESGDYFMVTSPYYHRIYNDLSDRAGVQILDVPFYGMQYDDLNDAYKLDVDIFEKVYQNGVEKGLQIKGLLLINPNNPTGICYTREQLIDILNFADKYKLHVVMDEIYALSVFDTSRGFTSVLSLPLPDPERVHVIWGFSKDFGLSGYRVGCVYSANKSLIHYCETVNIFTESAVPILNRLEHLISDTYWVENVYLPTYQTRLKEAFNMARDRLEHLGIRVYPSTGAFFVWADVTKYMKTVTFEEERELLDKILAGKVYVLTGKHNYCCEPGWIRIVFAINQEQLQLGLDRMEKVFMKINAEQKAIKHKISNL